MRYQTSPFSPSNRPRGGVQQQHQLLAPPCCCCSGRETLQALKWGGRSVGTRTSSFEPARTLVASCRLGEAAGSAAGSTAASVGIHWHSQKHAASSTVEVHTSPHSVSTCLQQLHKNSTESTLREHTSEGRHTSLETAALCCRHCATTASERDPKLPGPPA